MFALPQPLPDDPPTLQRLLADAMAEIARLNLLVVNLQRARFGRKSEQLGEEEFQRAFEEVQQALAEQSAKLDVVAEALTNAAPGEASVPKTPRRNRGALAAHLPRIETLVDIEDKSCPCCGAPLHAIGEDKAEMLDYVPARFRVRVVRRPRYGCRACSDAVVQAPAPERPIDGGLASEALLAHVLVGKYADHLPLYRQSQIYAREGVMLDRSTLADWVGRACWWLKPLHELLLSTVLASPVVFADDTTLPVLEPGNGRTKTGRLWCYAVDNRPWKGPGQPAAAYVYSENRKAAHPAAHLAGFGGVLQTDGYAGFAGLVGETGAEKLAFCWAHARRKFHDLYASTKAPLAGEALRRIADLYAVEADIRGHTAEQRLLARRAQSRPLVEALHVWLTGTLDKLSGRSAIAQAIRYTLNHWKGLTVFLDDGRVELDTNTVERAMRPIALGRKNALFAGSDNGAKHWAILATLLHTAKLNGVDPEAWLTDVLERIVSGRTKSNDLATLLPWAWQAERAEPTAGSG